MVRVWTDGLCSLLTCWQREQENEKTRTELANKARAQNEVCKKVEDLQAQLAFKNLELEEAERLRSACAAQAPSVPTATSGSAEAKAAAERAGDEATDDDLEISDDRPGSVHFKLPKNTQAAPASPLRQGKRKGGMSHSMVRDREIAILPRVDYSPSRSSWKFPRRRRRASDPRQEKRRRRRRT